MASEQCFNSCFLLLLISFHRYRNGQSIDVSDDHYKGGNSEHVALSIRHAVKEDIGNYTCELTNEAGQGTSEQQINLDVLCKSDLTIALSKR